MKAITVKHIFEELEKDCNNRPNGLHMNIDGAGFTNHFVISGDSSWTVNEDDCLLTLESLGGTQFIDTEKISRITI